MDVSSVIDAALKPPGPTTDTPSGVPRCLTAPWILYWTHTDVDGLPVRISARPEDRHTRTIFTADIHAESTGEWLATVFRLASPRWGALVRFNYRHRSVLGAREDQLAKSAIEFQAAIRAGEVSACIDHP